MTSTESTRLAQLESFLRQDPDNASLLHEAFGAALQAGEFDSAEFHCVHATRLGHNPWRWGLNAVHLDLTRHRWESAEQRARALRHEAGAPQALVEALDHAIAQALFRQQRWSEAVDLLEPAVARVEASGAPVAPATQALLLRLWHRQQAFERAIAWARARSDAHALAPEATGVASLLALDAGDFEAASRWARASLQSPPACAEALVAASSLATGSRDAASGQAFARQALALNPTDGRSWSALGLAQMLAGDLSTARASFETALRTMPDHVGTWISLGWAALLLNDAPGALPAFERAVALDRNFGEAQGGLAAAQAALGQREAALESIERARRLDPTGLSFHYAQRLVDGADPRDADDLLRLARRLLAQRRGPGGESMADWLPPERPAAD